MTNSDTTAPNKAKHKIAGLAHDGKAPKMVRLSNQNGMAVEFMDIGACWTSCQIPVGNDTREVLLGISSMQDYYRQKAYLGACIGRYANRIAFGRFKIGDRDYQLQTNEGDHTLHGGTVGFDLYRWTIDQVTDSSVTFSVCSPDGDQGFPGQLNASVCYSLDESNSLTIRYNAQCDRVTPLNLTNHAYFNLNADDGLSDCLLHELQIHSEQYLPVKQNNIPEGELAAVAGTRYDFRARRTIANENNTEKGNYDHSYLLQATADEKPQSAATLWSADGRLSLDVSTTKPAIQLYTGGGLQGTPNRLGGVYQAYAGVALETQFLPDSPNHPEWPQPSCFCDPSQQYEFETRYQLCE